MDCWNEQCTLSLSLDRYLKVTMVIEAPLLRVSFSFSFFSLECNFLSSSQINPEETSCRPDFQSLCWDQDVNANSQPPLLTAPMEMGPTTTTASPKPDITVHEGVYSQSGVRTQAVVLDEVDMFQSRKCVPSSLNYAGLNRFHSPHFSHLFSLHIVVIVVIVVVVADTVAYLAFETSSESVEEASPTSALSFNLSTNPLHM